MRTTAHTCWGTSFPDPRSGARNHDALYKVRTGDKGDQKAAVAWDYIVNSVVLDDMDLVVIVLYVDTAPKDSMPTDAVRLIGDNGMEDLINSFLDLGFTEAEIANRDLLSDQLKLALAKANT